jgi:hypothetical protein
LAYREPKIAVLLKITDGAVDDHTNGTQGLGSE